jgi:DNA-binding transcriptional LysR family regulator
MDTLRNMKTFVAVVDAGSFTAAANQIAATPGVVSRSISELEDHLRTRLLHRTTRRIALTEAGERYLNRCRDILAAVAEAEVEASAAHTQAAGTLKVFALASIGQHYIVPALAAFQARHPELTIDLTLSHTVPDMLEEGHDVVMLPVPDTLPDSNFVSHSLGAIDSVLCAAPRYIEAHGAPRTLQDLSDHVCLQLAQANFPADRWRLIGPEGECDFALPAGRFRVNMPGALSAALHEGVGIGALPLLSAQASLRSGALVRVLPDYRLHKLNVYALYASRKYLDAKIRRWVDFAREWIAEATRSDGAAMSDEHATQPVARRVPRSLPRERDGARMAAAAVLPLQASRSPSRH